MTHSGHLRERVNIERRVASFDALGQPSIEWQLVAAVWGDVRHLSGLETIKSSADTSLVRVSVRIRYATGLDAGMRVVHGGAIYDIKAVLNDPRKHYTDLVCEQVT